MVPTVRNSGRPHAAGPRGVAGGRSAQPARKVWQIGFLGDGSRAERAAICDRALPGRLRELGYLEGQNVVIEERWSEGRSERLLDLATELVRAQRRCHRDARRARNESCAGRHPDDPHRDGGVARSRRDGLDRQPCPAGRQHHGHDRLGRGARREGDPGHARRGAADPARGDPLERGKSRRALHLRADPKRGDESRPAVSPRWGSGARRIWRGPSSRPPPDDRTC